jgi:hypothetical protein
MEARIVKLDFSLARKYLEANNRFGEQAARLEALVKLERVVSERGKGRWMFWVYFKFEWPNETLGFIFRLHKRFPWLAEQLVFMANADFLLSMHVFVVREEGETTTITDFLKV